MCVARKPKLARGARRGHGAETLGIQPCPAKLLPAPMRRSKERAVVEAKTPPRRATS
jgi:hypothetical protein